ncbi:hypothetical protein M3Y97_00561800 [Aphelenchoides bicaudatus]|nr:hypothetical protein M3Y97_00561800 [Aphelenchoides bicaudatus]
MSKALVFLLATKAGVLATTIAVFCFFSNPVARASTYTAIYIQLSLICLVQALHIFFLIKRSFKSYDPLDLVPAFFTVSALSSVLIVQFMLSTNLRELLESNKQKVPPVQLNHTALTCILSAGIAIAVSEWIFYHWAYNNEQDRIEEAAKSTGFKSTNSEPSNDRTRERIGFKSAHSEPSNDRMSGVTNRMNKM